MMRLMVSAALAVFAVLIALPPCAHGDDTFLSPHAREMEKSIAKIKETLKHDPSAAESGEKSAGPKQSEGKEFDLSNAGFNVFKALALCVGIFLIGAAVAKRLRGAIAAPQGQRIKIIERTLVAPKTWLVMAEVDGRRVVMAAGSERVTFAPQGQTRDGVKSNKRGEGGVRAFGQNGRKLQRHVG